MDEIRKYVVGATSSSLVVVIFLILLARDTGKVTSSDITSFLLVIAILVLTYGTIIQWMKCVRKYVDFVIGQKMGEVVTEK